MDEQQTTERRCENCGAPLEWKPGEPRRDFLRRIYCNRTCWSQGKRRDWRRRFWRNVDRGQPNECWLWRGPTHDGYGMFFKDGRSCRAHIVMAETVHGSRPEGQEVRHLCAVRACVNPAHLKWGTRQENVMDMIHHSGHHNAKLTQENVREIRRRLGIETHQVIADEFGVSKATIDDVAAGRTWRWLNG